MKSLLSILCLSFVLCSCKKEAKLSSYDYQLSLSSGEISAVINGEQWKSDVCIPSYYRGAKSDTINITAKVFTNRLERQSLIFNLLYLRADTQKIETLLRFDSMNGYSVIDAGQWLNSSFLAMDDQVIENSYFLYEDSNTNNHITIEEYNLATKVVRGSFESNYVRSWLDKDRPLTQDLMDTLHFTSGRFKFYLK